MITTADALKVMLTVQGCHPRTAPRMDDPDATQAIATIWAELFNHHHLELPDLNEAVKKRAREGHADAPEPAEIITHARAIRRERDERTGPTPEYQTLCESKGQPTEAELAYNREKLAQLTAGIGDLPHA